MEFVLSDPDDAQASDWERLIIAAANGSRASIDFGGASDVMIHCGKKMIKFEVAVGGSGGNGWLSFKLPVDKCIDALTAAWEVARDRESNTLGLGTSTCM
jgi:hypothetical protein